MVNKIEFVIDSDGYMFFDEELLKRYSNNAYDTPWWENKNPFENRMLRNFTDPARDRYAVITNSFFNELMRRMKNEA